MIARDVTEDAIRQAAERIGVSFGHDGITPINRKGTAFRFVLRPIPPERKPYREYGRYYRRGHYKDRTVAAVCFHGHRDFYRVLFELCPGARVQTRQTRELEFKWYTAENFERVYESADSNIGSVYAPMYFSEACWCGDTHYDRVVERLTGDRPYENGEVWYDEAYRANKGYREGQS